MATTGSYNCTVGTYSLHNTESSPSKIFALARECDFQLHTIPLRPSAPSILQNQGRSFGYRR